MSMMVTVVVICMVLGFIDGWAKLYGASNNATVDPNAVTMGHHYQRDAMFHDMMGVK